MNTPRTTAQMKATTPWSMLGGRGGWIIAAILVEKGEVAAHVALLQRWTKKVTEPVAISSTAPADFPLRLLRGATYNHPVLLRPTLAPCSVQEETYGLSGPVARGPKRENLAICGR